MAKTVSKPVRRKTSGRKAVGEKAPRKANGPVADAVAADGPEMARTLLVVLVDRLAEEMRSGAPVPRLPDLTLDIVTHDGVPQALFGLLMEEGRERRRDEDRCNALLALLGGALGALRMAVEAKRGGPAAVTLMELFERLAAAAGAGTLPPDLLIGIARQFDAARLPLPEHTRDLIAAAAREPMRDVPVPTPESMADDLARAAEVMHHDPFLIHEQFREQFSVFPDEVRVAAVGAMIESEVPAIREAALGWLLDPDPEIGRAVAERIGAAARGGLVSAASVERLAAMRSWLPASIQEPVGAAVAACRGQGGSPRPVEAAAPARTVRFVATGCDGGGAQSVYALVDEADRHVFAALRMKHGHGLRETVLQDDAGPEESALFLEGVAQDIDCFDTSPDFVRDLIAHGLATGLAAGGPPPFELLRFLDTVGLPPVAPSRLDPEAIVAQLLDGLPEESRSPEAAKAALAASQGWVKTYHFPGSWSDPDEASVAAVQVPDGEKRQSAVLTRIVEPRRAHWGERLAWIAKAARGAAASPETARSAAASPETARGAAGADGGAPARVGRGRREAHAPDAWIDLALVARAFLGETPIDEIPLAAEIARRTIALHRQR